MFNIKITTSKNLDSSLHYGFYGNYKGKNKEQPHNSNQTNRNALNMVYGINAPSNYKSACKYFHKLMKKGHQPSKQTVNLIFSFTKQDLDFSNPGDIWKAERFGSHVIRRLYGNDVHMVAFPQIDGSHNEPHVHFICLNKTDRGTALTSIKHKYKGKQINNTKISYVRHAANQVAPKYGLGHAVRKGQHSRDYLENFKQDIIKGNTSNSKIFKAYADAFRSAKSKKEFRAITKKQGVISHFSRKYHGLYFTWQNDQGKRQFKKASDLPTLNLTSNTFKISYANALNQIKQNSRRYYVKKWQHKQKQAQSPVSSTRNTENGSERQNMPNKSNDKIPKITVNDLQPTVKQKTYIFKNQGWNGGDSRVMPNPMHISKEPLQHPIMQFHPKNPRINAALVKLTSALSMPTGNHQKNIARQAAIAKARESFDDKSAQIVTDNQQSKAFVRQQNKENAEQVREQNAEIASAQRYQMEAYYRNQGPSW